MKKLFFVLLLAIAFVGCNNGECGNPGDPCDQFGCHIYHKSELSEETKSWILSVVDWDSTKPATYHINDTLCFTILP